MTSSTKAVATTPDTGSSSFPLRRTLSLPLRCSQNYSITINLPDQTAEKTQKVLKQTQKSQNLSLQIPLRSVPLTRRRPMSPLPYSQAGSSIKSDVIGSKFLGLAVQSYRKTHCDKPPVPIFKPSSKPLLDTGSAQSNIRTTDPEQPPKKRQKTKIDSDTSPMQKFKVDERKIPKL